MLISVNFPFSDYRSLVSRDFTRLTRPAWPTPTDESGHVRRIGCIQRRRKSGFEGWVGEGHLAVGLSGLSLRLPYSYPDLGRVRLIRKAGYFDGLVNGRFELLFGMERAAPDLLSAKSAAARLLAIETKATRVLFNGPLLAAASSLRELWGTATVAHGMSADVETIRSGRPVCIVESDTQIAGMEEQVSFSGPALETPVALIEQLLTKPPIEIIILSNRSSESKAGRTRFRYISRYARTYAFRLLQNVEAISLLLSRDDIDLNDDSVQFVLNEYTRQISRSFRNTERLLMKTSSNTVTLRLNASTLAGRTP